MTRDESMPLSGLTVLLVEDLFHIAEEMRRMVELIGGRCLGPVGTVADALELVAATAPDLALLDIDLDDKPVYPVADALQSRRIPFVFATGYEAWVIDARFKDIPIVEKPMTMRGLREAIGQLRMTAPDSHAA